MCGFAYQTWTQVFHPLYWNFIRVTLLQIGGVACRGPMYPAACQNASTGFKMRLVAIRAYDRTWIKKLSTFFCQSLAIAPGKAHMY